MMRRLALLSLRSGIVVLALALAAPRAEATAPPPMRYQNFHGVSCQSAHSTDPVSYSDQGANVSSTATSPVALSCPVSWSLDATTSALQEIRLTATFAGAPASFDPGCTFTMHTVANFLGGSFTVPPGTPIGAGTATPTLVFSFTFAAGVSAVFYENVIGSVLYCTGVPAGVTLSGYSIVTCISGTSDNCAPI
jgi:hypothetical protein